MKDSKVKYHAKNIIVMTSMLLVGLCSSHLSRFSDINIGIKLSGTVSPSGLSLAAIVGVTLNLVLNRLL